MRKRLYLVLVIILSVLLSSCMNQKGEEGKNVEKKEKAPETLSKVSDGLDSLLLSIDSIEELMELTEQEFQAMNSKEEESKGKDNQSKESNEQNQEQGKQESKNQGQESKKQDTRTKAEELFMKWQEVDKGLEEIHKSWNSYEVEGLEKGATAGKGEEFKKDLNDLTVAVENRDIKSILDKGSKAFNTLAAFFDLYKDEIRGDLLRIKYSAHQAFILSQNGNKEEANKLLDETQEHTSRLRQKLKEDKVKDLEKLSLSITDMQKALESNSMELLKIKRDIVNENIKAIQE